MPLLFGFSRMTRHNRWLIRYFAAGAALLIRSWMSTIRVRVATADGRIHPADPASGRFVYAFWHESLLAPLATRPKIRVLISQHTDGEVIAQICQRLGIGVIRGSTARGGSQALLEMIREAGESTHLGITPDGPRGPRRELKPGIIMVASQTGLPIVPVGVGFVRAWRFQSWDRFALPWLGSTVVGVLGEPTHVPRDLDRGGLSEWKQVVQNRLLELTELAEEWAARIRSGNNSEPPAIVPLAVQRRSA